MQGLLIAWQRYIVPNKFIGYYFYNRDIYILAPNFSIV